MNKKIMMFTAIFLLSISFVNAIGLIGNEVRYYPLDEDSGGNVIAIDYAQGYNITSNQGAWNVSGVYNTAWQYIGSAEVNSIPTSSSINFDSESNFSYSFWLNISDYPGAGDSWILDNTPSALPGEFGIEFAIGSDGKVLAQLCSFGVACYNIPSLQNIGVNEWHFIYVEYLNHTLRLYINNTLQGLLEFNNTGLVSPNSNWEIGYGDGSRHITFGNIDDLRIFSSPVSSYNLTYLLTASFPCTESWIANDTSCNGANYTIRYYDNSSCGTNTLLPIDNGTIVSCSITTTGFVVNNVDTSGLITVIVAFMIVVLIGSLLLAFFNKGDDIMRYIAIISAVFVALLIIFLMIAIL